MYPLVSLCLPQHPRLHALFLSTFLSHIHLRSCRHQRTTRAYVCPCVCVFDVRPAFFGALCFHGVCCCFCCFSLLLLLLQCPWAHICMFYCICSQFRPPPSTPATPLPLPPPYAMRVPMFLILYIDIWPPGCQKREPLPKVDCGSLSEARSVGGGQQEEEKGESCPLPLTGPGSASSSPSPSSLAAILLLKYA